MRTPLAQLIPQGMYVDQLREMESNIKEFMKLAPADEVAKFRKFRDNPPAYHAAVMSDEKERKQAALNLLKARKRVLEKAGMTSSLGYNFYDLRGPALLLYPVNVPFRNLLPRSGRVNDGYGTAAHWNATRNFGSQYAGVLEGQRNAVATPDFNPYTATYKELGVERAATFTSQFAGEGYTDNVADEHLRGLHELWLQEEGIMLMGNSGTASGNNGYLLGTMNTPVAALATGGALGSGVTVCAFAVALTALGNPKNTQYGYGLFPTVSGGLTPAYTRSNQDGSTTPLNGGISAISLVSNQVTTDSGHQKVTFTATPVRGAFAYAWYVNVLDTTKGNALLAGISTFPTFTIATTVGIGTQTAAATGLNADHSAQVTDFDGLLSYAISAGYLIDGAGANLTKGVGGSVVEIDTDLQFLWDAYQAQPDAIWCSSDAKTAISNTILASTNGLSAFRFQYEKDSQGDLLGGFVVSAYKSKYTMNATGGEALPLRIHPMLPPGTIYYDINTNPYPHDRIPFVRGMLVQRDYYSIEWPLVTRQWQFGTYCHEVLAHYLPWLSAVRCGIGGAGA